MKRKFKEFLYDILFEIEVIEEATKNISLKEFKENIILIRAVTKSLEIVGEAVSNVPDDLKEKYDEVEWRRIKGFRDVVVHKYWEVDVVYEWEIVRNKLGVLKHQIEVIIKKEKEDK